MMGLKSRFLRGAAFGLSAGAIYLLLQTPEELPPSENNPQTVVSSINGRIEEALFQEENIPLLEKIIAEEIAFFRTLENSQSLGRRTEEQVVDYFTAELRPLFDDFLNVDTYDFPGVDFGIEAAFSKILQKPESVVMLGAWAVLALNCFWMVARFGMKAYVEINGKKEGEESLGVVPLLFAGTWGSLGAFLGMFGYNLVVSNANSFSLDNRINLSYTAQFEEPETLALVFGHELTHSLQWQYGVVPSDYVYEGHASGVQEYLRHEIYERTGNTAFIYETGRLRLGELLSTYTEICEQFGIEPKPFAEGLEIEFNDTAHSRGTALFAIRERQWGDQIYPALLEGDYCPVLYSPQEMVGEDSSARPGEQE